MNTIKSNQSGVGHIVLVVVILIVFAGLAGLAYARVGNYKKDAQTTASTGQASQIDGTEQETNDDKATVSGTDDDHVNPSEL